MVSILTVPTTAFATHPIPVAQDTGAVTALPATIIAKVDVEAFRGGYLQRKHTISKPF